MPVSAVDAMSLYIMLAYKQNLNTPERVPADKSAAVFMRFALTAPVAIPRKSTSNWAALPALSHMTKTQYLQEKNLVRRNRLNGIGLCWLSSQKCTAS